MTTPASVDSDLGWALGAVMRSYLRAAGEAVSGVPGGPRGYQVLVTAGMGEPSTQVALAQHLGIDRTMMTYLLDDLENAGLVERRPDPADRRARRVAITAAGTARLSELKHDLRRAEDRLLEPLDSAERNVLRGLLQRLATTMAPANPCQLAQECTEAVAADASTRRRRR